MKVFSCTSYVHDEFDTQSKLDVKSRKYFFIGYGNDAFGYRFWDDQNQKIIRSWNVTFNECTMYKDGSGAEPKVTEQGPKKSEFVNLDELLESTIKKEKQFVEVELDEQRSLTDEYDDEEFSRALQHRKECYSLARGK